MVLTPRPHPIGIPLCFESTSILHLAEFCRENTSI